MRDDLAVAVAHREHRGVAVAEQEDLGAVDLQRVVDPQVVGPRPGARLGGVAHREPGSRGALRAACRRAGSAPRGPSSVDRERREAVSSVRAPGVEVSYGDRVLENAVALHHEHVALVAEQVAEADRDEQQQQREVEHQVAGLAQVALLGATRRRRRTCDPEPPAAQRGPRLGQRRPPACGRTTTVACSGSRYRLRGARGGWARSADRCCRLRGSDAADQRDEQQQVDRGEPRRGVDGEQPEPVVATASGVGCCSANCAALRGVDAALRHQRAGDRGEREQEQQHQRRAHRGELPPGPAGAARPGCIAGGRRLGSATSRAGALVERSGRPCLHRRDEAVGPHLDADRRGRPRRR